MFVDTWSLVGQPAAWTMPLAFLTVIVVSKLTPDKIPAGTARSMVRLHTPEAVDVDRGLPLSPYRSS